ncbi:Butyryl-CoA dehydrogenase [Labilithrix luteola]|uniref:Butyryl-CoA dehydrogenase n=1 Tax=Labilithrix luteola TaxID=1391654 RepID=A0A0K1QAJ0_9BACT|nr:acyl-CoA dehydrogenase family protein [Labilithrix luteola]AKV02749.1 Butyryl-CoA dehydrogenase [Labilithrix luteola]
MIDFELTEEQRALIETAKRFAKERIIPVAAEADRKSEFPREVFHEAWKLGLANPTLPAEYGGPGLPDLESAMITEELAYGCSGIQTSITANTLGMTPIKLAGSEEQKKKYLGWLMSEPIWVSYATTEPGAGSDVAGMQCRATKQSDGSYVLNGTKAWITNANLASFYVIFATENPELRHKGIGAFIVHRDAKGLTVGKHEDKLGQRASDTAQVMLDGVVVPAAQVLAPPGHGFKVAMETFNQTRPDIGAIAVGIMRRCLDECVAYSKERKTFGTPIANHQLVQAMIAEMAIRIQATRLLVHKAAWSLDKGIRDPLTSSCAKAYGADAAMQSATDAVQIFGGNGYVKEYPVEKLMRDAKILQIYEGTAQIQRIVIAKQLLGT